LSAVRQKSGATFSLVAVLPQEKSLATAYLGDNGITVDEVFSLPLQRVEVRGTPMILLLSNGKVKAAWSGKLAPNSEQQVLSEALERCVGCG
jgi:hypothetical protein